VLWAFSENRFPQNCGEGEKGNQVFKDLAKYSRLLKKKHQMYRSNTISVQTTSFNN